MRSDVDWGDSTLAKVVVPVLNVRSGPGTNHAIIDQVSADDMLTVVRTNSTGDWLQVIIDDQGNMGWISGLPEYTQIVGSLQDVPTVQATAPPPSPTPSRQIDVDRILERIQEKQEAKLTLRLLSILEKPRSVSFGLRRKDISVKTHVFGALLPQHINQNKPSLSIFQQRTTQCSMAYHLITVGPT
ncbi:MAG: SH3 domain-containing protein [Anaerolineales bacterium]|nr:SH3 domain-containing protein [Anaerolineales bacterium]